MTTAPSRRRDPAGVSKGDRREAQLIAAGRQLVVAGDFEDASVSDLAAAAGVSRPTFYFYFASKQELLARLIALTLHDVAASLAQELDRTPAPPIERLRAAIAHGADTWWENRAVMRSAHELAAVDANIYDHVMAAFEPVDALCTDLLIEHGTVPEARSLTAARALVVTLAMMNQRALAHAVRTARTRDDLRATEALVLNIWSRAMGLAVR